MKRVLIAALLLTTTRALAQNAAQPDPELLACQQVLANSNAQTIGVAAQLQKISKQLDAANAEIAKLKEPAKP